MFYKIYDDYSISSSTGNDRGSDFIGAYETLEEAIKHCPSNVHRLGMRIDYFIYEVHKGKETIIWKQTKSV